MSEELKPCPFCGGEAELFTMPANYGLSPIRWVIRCKRGCCEQIPHISDHDAVFAWNKRTYPEWMNREAHIGAL